MAEARFLTLGMKVALASALVLVAGAFVLFVLPGFAIYQAGDLPFGGHFGAIHGDNLLPIAMQVQLLWAPAIPIGYALVRRWLWSSATGARHSSSIRSLVSGAVFAIILYAWAVLLAVFFHSQLGRFPAA
jgi:hypothetical protein